MSENVIIAALALLGTISTAASGVLIALVARQHKTVERVREQVENSHGTILRDDVDEIRAAVEGVADDLRGLRKDVGRLDRRNIEDGVDRRLIASKVDRVGEKVDAHLVWSHDYVNDRERADRALRQRLSSLETTVNPKKESE